MLNKESQKCIDIIKKVNKLIKLDFIQSDDCVFDDQFKIVKKLWSECAISGERAVVNGEEAREILMQNLDSPFISNRVKKL